MQLKINLKLCTGRLITIGMLLTISEIWVEVKPGVNPSVLLTWQRNALGRIGSGSDHQGYNTQGGGGTPGGVEG